MDWSFSFDRIIIKRNWKWAEKIVAKSKLYRLLQQFQLGITFQLSGAMQTRAYE